MLFDRVVPSFFLGALFFLEVPTRSLSLSFFDPFICLMTAPRVLRDNRFNNNNNNNNKKEPGRKTRYQPDGKGPPEPDGLDHVRHDEVRAAHLSFFFRTKMAPSFRQITIFRRRLSRVFSSFSFFSFQPHQPSDRPQVLCQYWNCQYLHFFFVTRKSAWRPSKSKWFFLDKNRQTPVTSPSDVTRIQ